MRAFKIMAKNVRAFRTTVGMSLRRFGFLIMDVEKAYPGAERKRLDRPGRRRRSGAGPRQRRSRTGQRTCVDRHRRRPAHHIRPRRQGAAGEMRRDTFMPRQTTAGPWAAGTRRLRAAARS